MFVIFFSFFSQWLTFIQFAWPILIFVALYSLRLKFGAKIIEECQFPTRQLPSSTGLLPFFQSYICTVENACSSTKDYEEFSQFKKAPWVSNFLCFFWFQSKLLQLFFFKLLFSITPITHIVQMFLNEDKLFHAIVDLPQTANFLGTITSIATHPKFSVLEGNIKKWTCIKIPFLLIYFNNFFFT